jgi:hypothetical protein
MLSDSDFEDTTIAYGFPGFENVRSDTLYLAGAGFPFKIFKK